MKIKERFWGLSHLQHTKSQGSQNKYVSKQLGVLQPIFKPNFLSLQASNILWHWCPPCSSAYAPWCNTVGGLGWWAVPNKAPLAQQTVGSWGRRQVAEWQAYSLHPRLHTEPKKRQGHATNVKGNDSLSEFSDSFCNLLHNEFVHPKADDCDLGLWLS